MFASAVKAGRQSAAWTVESESEGLTSLHLLFEGSHFEEQDKNVYVDKKQTEAAKKNNTCAASQVWDTVW